MASTFFDLIKDDNDKIGCKLNYQLIDLFMLISERKPKEDKEKAIQRYQERLISKEIDLKKEEHIETWLLNCENALPEIPTTEFDRIKVYYIKEIKEKGRFIPIDTAYSELIQVGVDITSARLFVESIKCHDIVEYDGIKSLTYEEIDILYHYIKTNFKKISFKDITSYSFYMFDHNRENEKNKKHLETMIYFAKENGMSIHATRIIDATTFPKTLEKERREKVYQTLEYYILTLIKNYGKYFDSIDMFYELTNNKAPFHIRNDGWQKILSIEEFCDIALKVKKLFPQLLLTYNDREIQKRDPESTLLKAETIRRVIEQILGKEKEYHMGSEQLPMEVHLIDSIGIEGHFNLDIDLNHLNMAIETLAIFHIPIDITELSVERKTTSILYPDPDSPFAIGKQNEIICQTINLLKQKKINHITIDNITDKLSKEENASVLLNQNINLKDLTYFTKKVMTAQKEATEIRAFIEKILLPLTIITTKEKIYQVIEQNESFQHFIAIPNNNMIVSCFIEGKTRMFTNKYQFITYLFDQVQLLYTYDEEEKKRLKEEMEILAPKL